MQGRKERNILEEALKHVHGDRNEAYGNPAEDFGRTAAAMTALLAHKLRPGVSLTAEDVARFHIVNKLSRSVNAYRRDNWIDIAGYAETADWCHEAE